MEQSNELRSSPKDVFLHLLNIVTFYISVIAFITLYIQYIRVLFPDPLVFYFTGIAAGVRTSTSILVVAVPVFILTSWLLGRDFAQNQARRELKLRKWLLYFTLFISSLTIIIDLIVIVNNFLSGELTIQFFLKTLVVLVVAAAVFGYYIWELRRKDNGQSKTPRLLARLLGLAVLISVSIGFFIVGTPAAQRNRRFDEQRVSNLQMLQSQIIYYWTQKNALPEDLSRLEDSISGFVVPQDPELELSYGYKIVSPLSFELCAAFKTSNKNLNFDKRGIYDSFQKTWEHDAGEVCFLRTIDPELYKSEAERLKAPAVPILFR